MGATDCGSLTHPWGPVPGHGHQSVAAAQEHPPLVQSALMAAHRPRALLGNRRADGKVPPVGRVPDKLKTLVVFKDTSCSLLKFPRPPCHG